MAQSLTSVPAVIDALPITRFGFGGGTFGSLPSPGSMGSALAAEARQSADSAAIARNAMRRKMWVVCMVISPP